MLINSLLIQSNVTIREAMELMDSGGKGVCFVIEGTKLVGLVTDGDIRRAILNGEQLTNSISNAMQKNFFSLPIGTPLDIVQKNLLHFKYIPFINENNEIEDYYKDIITGLHFYQSDINEKLAKNKSIFFDFL